MTSPLAHVLGWDSYEYLSQTVHPLAGPRPWAVPFLWGMVYPAHHLDAIVTLQALCWAVSWGSLAWTMRAWSRPALMLVTALALWAWGWVPQLCSESLAFSALALLAAATISRSKGWCWLVIATFWASTRPENAYALVWMGLAWAMARRWRMGVASVLVGVALMLPAAGTSSQALRLLDVVEARILPVPAHADWFASRGMPLPGLLIDHAGQSMDAPFPYRDRSLSGWYAWAQREGFGLYARFLATHPGVALTSWVGPSLGSPLAVLAGLALLGVVLLRGTQGALFAALVGAQCLLIWHGDAKEYTRHFLQPLLVIAMAALWAIEHPRTLRRLAQSLTFGQARLR